MDAVLEELREIKEGQSHLEDSMEDLKAQLQRDYTYMTQCLQEERYRCVRRPAPPHLREGPDFRFGGGSRRSISQRRWKGPGGGPRGAFHPLPGRLEDRMTGPLEEALWHPYLITWWLYKRGNRGRGQLIWRDSG